MEWAAIPCEDVKITWEDAIVQFDLNNKGDVMDKVIKSETLWKDLPEHVHVFHPSEITINNMGMSSVSSQHYKITAWCEDVVFGGSKSIDVEKVIFSGPCTIVIFKDGHKEIVRCAEDNEFDKTTGLAFALLKNIYGNSFNDIFKEFVWNDEEEVKKKTKKKSIRKTRKTVKR